MVQSLIFFGFEQHIYLLFLYCPSTVGVFSLILWPVKTVMNAHTDATEHPIICPPVAPALEECPLPTLCALKNCLHFIWKYLLSSSVFMSFNGILTYIFHANYLCIFFSVSSRSIVKRSKINGLIKRGRKKKH